MSTAVLISGQLRTFARCWPTQRWHVLRHFDAPHFFICVQAQPEWSEILQPLIDEYGPERVHIDLKGDPDLSEHLTPDLSLAYHHAPYANAAPAHQLLLQHWYQNECWKFFQSQPQSILQKETKDTKSLQSSAIPSSSFPSLSSVQKFETIIRLRADLWFHSFDSPVSYIEGQTGRERVAHDLECYTPWWGRFGGINDRFAIMGPEAAKYYFGVYDHIPELLAAGCPFHPESLVRANLERGNVELHETLRTEFSTERVTGERRWPEITPIDIAHCALRAA